MAIQIPALTELVSIASGDWLYVVDVSDTTDGANGSGRKIQRTNLVAGLVVSGGALGTPSSGTLTNCTFPTLNQNTSGSAASLSVSGQTGLITLTGLASTNRVKTVRDAADTILELGGSYTPTGTWTNLTLANPSMTTPALGVATGTSFSGTGLVHAWNGTAIPAGGTAGTGFRLSSTSNFGVFFGSGVPTLSAGQGSLYLRSDGAPYYNNNGTTGWTAVAASVDQAANYTWTGTHNFNSATVTFGTFSVTTLNVSTTLTPTTDDGAPLGDTTHNFSDLFLATGAVINYANSNVVITHTSGILTMGTGDFRVTTAGTNSASVVTVGGTQTLTNKSLSLSQVTGLGTGVSTVLGQAANGSAADGPGYRGIPQNSQSAAYTTVMADNGKCIFHPASDANARTFTIDSNANVAYPIGAVIEFANRSANNVTIAITSDTLTFFPGGSTGSRTLAQYGKAVAEKIGTTEWAITGNSALT